MWYIIYQSFVHYDKNVIINEHSAVSVFVSNSYRFVISNDHDDVGDLNKYSGDEGEMKNKYILRD